MQEGEESTGEFIVARGDTTEVLFLSEVVFNSVAFFVKSLGVRYLK